MVSKNGPPRIGIGGPVGSGKTAMTEKLCKAMREHYPLAVVTAFAVCASPTHLSQLKADHRVFGSLIGLHPIAGSSRSMLFLASP